MIEDFYTSDDKERFILESQNASNRSAFEKDKARLIYSAGVNRLQFKTQIFSAGSEDGLKTRLTHSLEVAQIGRRIAQTLKLNPELVECACLAHDIGHPPYGHIGEGVLNEIAKDIGGFEANAQTFRLLTRLEPKVCLPGGKSVGLNLTRGSLDAIIKYPWSYYQSGEHKTDSSSTKFNYYLDDKEIFEWVRSFTPVEKMFSKSIEAQVMDISDDISYSVHDFADGVKKYLITPDILKYQPNIDKILDYCFKNFNHGFSQREIEDAFIYLRDKAYFDLDFNGSLLSHAKLVKLTSDLIGEFVSSITNETLSYYKTNNLTRYNADIIIPPSTKAQILILKTIEWIFVMNNEELLDQRVTNSKLIRKVVESFMTSDNYMKLDNIFMDPWEKSTNDDQRLRVVIDQVASLTDTSIEKIEKSL